MSLSSSKTDDKVQLVVRMKPEMAEALRAMAKKEDRTLSQQVRYLLREALIKDQES